MAFNGSGVFTRLYNWVNDAAANIKIRADRMDNEMNGFATGLSTCITKDGQTTITANLPMAGFKHTGVGAAAAATEYARYDQVQSGAAQWAGTSAGTNTVTATPNPAISAYAAGQAFRFKVGGTNTGAVTLNLDLSAVAVQKNGAALVAGDWTLNDVVEVTFDGTQFQDITPKRTPVIKAAGIQPVAIGNTEATIASATSTDLGSTNVNVVAITGTTTITGFGSSAVVTNPIYFVRFTGILTLTHNGTSLIIPGAANITTANGDTLIAEYLGSGNWKVLSYQKVSGLPVINPQTTYSRQYLTSGTGATYTTPANCRAILVKAWGGGGGGAAQATNAGSNGTATIFNSVNANPGLGAPVPTASKGQTGGLGGSAGTGTATFRMRGANGQPTTSATTGAAGGNGGATSLGGNGYGLLDSAGQAAVANSGSGGGGATAGSNGSGPGGGAGEYFELYIPNPAASYTYTIGGGGNGGAAGGVAGGNGGSGCIIVEEYYS